MSKQSQQSNPDAVPALLSGIAENAPAVQYHHADKRELIRAINKVCAIVPRGDEMRFVFDGADGTHVFRREKDAALTLSQYQFIPEAKGEKPARPEAGFPIWLKSPDRRTFDRIVFELDPRKVGRGDLNLWRGFAIQPAPGDWSLMRDHIFANVCQGNVEAYDFLMAVLAQMFQEPWRKIGIAVCLRGPMGVGKSKLSDWLGKIIGSAHAPAIDKPGQLTGQFTGQLEYALLARVEEGFYPGNPQEAAAIKHLITSGTLMIERKRMDMIERPNFTRVFITSNSDRPIAAAAGERRYLFLEVGAARKQDGAYFAAIDKQMAAGGAAAMLHDLMHLDYSAVDFSKPPVTEGLHQQMRLSFTPEEKWLEAIVADGCLPFTHPENGSDCETWEHEGQAPTIDKDDVVRSYRDFVPGFRGVPATAQQVGAFLNKHIPRLREARLSVMGKRKRHWIFPKLADMRAAFITAHPGYQFPEIEERSASKSGRPIEILVEMDAGHEVISLRRRGN